MQKRSLALIFTLCVLLTVLTCLMAVSVNAATIDVSTAEQLIASEDKTIHADLSGIPAGDYDTPIYAWVFAKFAEDSDYKIYPLGTFTVNGSYYNAPEVEEG